MSCRKETSMPDLAREIKTVLCVDDEEGVLASLRRILHPFGHRVLSARDGEEGVRMAQEEQPDLIILDLRMPKMDGLQALKELRELGMGGTPVILLTADSSTGTTLEAYREGGVYYITKPFKSTTVQNIVEYLIGDLTPEQRQKLETML
jgi:two-component system response regulator AtoC